MTGLKKTATHERKDKQDKNAECHLRLHGHVVIFIMYLLCIYTVMQKKLSIYILYI